jgi:Flp pilus assembly protein protease CpaA
MGSQTSTPLAIDNETHVTALLGGSGIVLMQAFALFPGLFPCLLLALPFVLPVLVLGAVFAIPFLLFRAAWRLAASAAEAASERRSHSRAEIRQRSDVESREALPHASTIR